MLEVCEALHDARVLVVDDEPDICSVVAEILEHQGAHTDCAGSAEEGLEHLASGRYDLFWIDLRLPGMSGLELLRRIRETDPFARVVLMTAYGDGVVYENAMTSGATGMVCKPFTARQVVSVSEHAVDPS